MHVFNLLFSSSSMCSCDGRKKVWDIIQEMAAHHHPHASCLVRNRPRCSSCLGLLQTKRKEQFNSRDVNLDQPIYTTTTPWLRTLTGILQYVAHDLSLTAGISFCDWNYTKKFCELLQHACVQININSISQGSVCHFASDSHVQCT